MDDWINELFAGGAGLIAIASAVYTRLAAGPKANRKIIRRVRGDLYGKLEEHRREVEALKADALPALRHEVADTLAGMREEIRVLSASSVRQADLDVLHKRISEVARSNAKLEGMIQGIDAQLGSLISTLINHAVEDRK